MLTPHLYYFDPEEFVRVWLEDGRQEARDWFALMNTRLLVMLDVFRHQWGAPVRLSPNPEALGRHLGPDKASEHNIDYWGTIMAADVFPEGMNHPGTMNEAVTLATGLGFTGIGLYPDWSPSPGLHLGVRPSRRPGEPATWGALRDGSGQRYVSLQEALDHARQAS